MYEYKARLMERSNGRHPVYDGDTVWLTVDLGFGMRGFDLGSCRLYGIDTPEMRKETYEAGKAARDYVREALGGMPWFRITTSKDDAKGKYGRYLVTIWLDERFSLNEDLVARGYAVLANY